MEDKQLQAIRYKLQKRVRRLNSSDHNQFAFLLRQFFVYFNSSSLLSGVRDDLVARTQKYQIQNSVEAILKESKDLYGENEEEAAAIGYEMLQRVVKQTGSEDIVMQCRRFSTGLSESLEIFRTKYLEPFYEYMDEHIDDQHIILYLLEKYKHRCEWFHSKRLREMILDDTTQGERRVALDLYEYLHNAGIDFHIEPRSASGIPDFITEQIGDDRIVADTKLFSSEKGKGKSYIISGYNQIYTYMCDYNEAFGYLIIFNLDNTDLRILFPPTSSHFPSYTYNNKTVYFVVIDIYDHPESASKRGRKEAITLSDTDLVRTPTDS